MVSGEIPRRAGSPHETPRSNDPDRLAELLESYDALVRNLQRELLVTRAERDEARRMADDLADKFGAHLVESEKPAGCDVVSDCPCAASTRHFWFEAFRRLDADQVKPPAEIIPTSKAAVEVRRFPALVPAEPTRGVMGRRPRQFTVEELKRVEHLSVRDAAKVLRASPRTIQKHRTPGHGKVFTERGCSWPSCTRRFTPTAPRHLYCDEHTSSARRAVPVTKPEPGPKTIAVPPPAPPAVETRVIEGVEYEVWSAASLPASGGGSGLNPANTAGH